MAVFPPSVTSGIFHNTIEYVKLSGGLPNGILEILSSLITLIIQRYCEYILRFILPFYSIESENIYLTIQKKTAYVKLVTDY